MMDANKLEDREATLTLHVLRYVMTIAYTRSKPASPKQSYLYKRREFAGTSSSHIFLHNRWCLTEFSLHSTAVLITWSSFP